MYFQKAMTIIRELIEAQGARHVAVLAGFLERRSESNFGYPMFRARFERPSSRKVIFNNRPDLRFHIRSYTTAPMGTRWEHNVEGILY